LIKHEPLDCHKLMKVLDKMEDSSHKVFSCLDRIRNDVHQKGLRGNI
jgi:hypothetical protein